MYDGISDPARMALTSETPAAHVDADLLTLIPPADELTALAEHWPPRFLGTPQTLTP